MLPIWLNAYVFGQHIKEKKEAVGDLFRWSVQTAGSRESLKWMKSQRNVWCRQGHGHVKDPHLRTNRETQSLSPWVKLWGTTKVSSGPCAGVDSICRKCLPQFFFPGCLWPEDYSICLQRLLLLRLAKPGSLFSQIPSILPPYLSVCNSWLCSAACNNPVSLINSILKSMLSFWGWCVSALERPVYPALTFLCVLVFVSSSPPHSGQNNTRQDTDTQKSLVLNTLWASFSLMDNWLFYDQMR